MQNIDVLISQLLLPAFLVFALVWALVGAAIGAGLIASHEATLRFFAQVNTWVSMRSRVKWAEQPRDTGRAVLVYRAWFAVVFIAGGIFTLVVLLGQFDVGRIVARQQVVLAWLLESLRWILVAGSLLAITVGVLLAFFPAAMTALEARVNRWVSTRQAARSIGEDGDRMHLLLDRCVAASPRTAGWIIVVLSVGCVVATGSTLFFR